MKTSHARACTDSHGGGVIHSLQLPFRFEVGRLKSELAKVEAGDWVPHYNERDYGGEWHGVALRSLSGQSRYLVAGQEPSASYADTELLERSPYFQEVVSSFACPLKSVRLLRLKAGSVIREHTDPALGYEDGEVRIHVPIQTNLGVEFSLAGQSLQFEEGGCYYVNVSLPHRVENRGSEDRIHLVLDTDVNEWMRALFRCGKPVPRCERNMRGIEAFRTAMLSDVTLQQTLHLAEDWPKFVQIALEAARERGFTVDPEDLEAWRGRPVLEFAQPNPPVGPWLPVTFEDKGTISEWVYFGQRRFTEPFFDDTARAALQNPFARATRHRAPLGLATGTTPSGIIFHMSRCGSTLVSQALGGAPHTACISEAPAIDGAIQAKSVEGLRRVVAALSHRDASETRLVIKMDAWHIHDLPLVREAFPGTPWIFVFRDPVEVLVSQLLSPGKFTLPGAIDPQALRLSLHEVTSLSREQWCARVLADICRAAISFRDHPKALFVEYCQLPDAVWASISRHFDLPVTSEIIASMRASATRDTKFPSRNFEADSIRKQTAATDAVRELAQSFLIPLYSELRTLTRGT